MGKIMIWLQRKVIIITCIYFSMSSCAEVDRPSKKISKDLYQKDSVYLGSTLRKMVDNNIDPFVAKNEFDNHTSIFIDSIIYSPNYLRAVVLVITDNLNAKFESNSFASGKTYNGNYFFCFRDTISSPLNIIKYSPWGLIHFESFETVKKRLRDECFRLRSSQRWSEEESKYNMTDNRFWLSDEFNSVIKHSKIVTFE